MLQPLPSRRLRYEEYIRFSERDERRLEFLNGVILEQAESSRSHEVIISNLSLALGASVRDAGCEFFTRGSVWSPEKEAELCPDWLVVSDERDLYGVGPEFSRSRYRFPRMAVEVLSPSSSGAEMTARFSIYNSIRSIENYLIIDSVRQQVWDFIRKNEDLVESKGGSIVETPFGSITVEQIYRNSGVPAL